MLCEGDGLEVGGAKSGLAGVMGTTKVLSAGLTEDVYECGLHRSDLC